MQCVNHSVFINLKVKSVIRFFRVMRVTVEDAPPVVFEFDVE